MNNITLVARIEERANEIVVFGEARGVTVDRPQTTGYVVPRLDLAIRLAHAIDAGAVFTNVEVRTDINGHTYISAQSNILGRMLNADLKRLGF